MAIALLQTLVQEELYPEWVAAGIRKAELARRLGIPKTSVERLFGTPSIPVRSASTSVMRPDR